MQHELNILEQRWGLALQSAQFGVWDLDVPGQAVHYSPQWKALLGYGDDDAIDSTAIWRARVHPDDLPPMLETLTGHLRGETPVYETEFRLRAADGRYRWVLSRGRVVQRDAQGLPLRAVGTLTDLTDRKEAEAMRIERDRAEAASRAKSEFLSRMSHEFRTPLNAVLGFAQVLSRQLGHAHIDDQRSFLVHIEQAGWRLLNMVNDVLDLSSADGGRVDVQLEAVALAPVLHSVCDAMRAAANRREVAIHLVEPTPGATVRADAARLKQVLGIVLSNAVKFNRDRGSVTLTVVEGPDDWTVTVTDTGVGIPAGQMPHLFEPFQRLHRASGPHGDGLGISLALSHWLVGQMGGRIGVRSTEGVGTTFELTLPREPAR